MDDLTKQENAVKLLRSSKSDDEWNANVDAIKAANNGYPGWWYSVVIATRLPAEVSSGWDGSRGNITITSL